MPPTRTRAPCRRPLCVPLTHTHTRRTHPPPPRPFVFHSLSLTLTPTEPPETQRAWGDDTNTRIIPRPSSNPHPITSPPLAARAAPSQFAHLLHHSAHALSLPFCRLRRPQQKSKKSPAWIRQTAASCPPASSTPPPPFLLNRMGALQGAHASSPPTDPPIDRVFGVFPRSCVFSSARACVFLFRVPTDYCFPPPICPLPPPLFSRFSAASDLISGSLLSRRLPFPFSPRTFD